ncbi:MAG: protein-L-isoaspartate(D-aspartate) O-methyltransferase [Nitrospinota bacterium]|mgnify:CR=1 FL=1
MIKSGLKKWASVWKINNPPLKLSYPSHVQKYSITIIFLLLLSLTLTISFIPPINAAEDRFASARKKMVENDLKGRDIKDPKVIEIMGRVERHRFVDKHLQSVAYADHPLPIDEGQTISQPYIVALMTQILKLKPDEKVLEIGTGSGYQAAILSEITKNVYTIEIRKNLSEKAEARLKELGYRNVKGKAGDGYFGWEEYAPFDAIIVTCAANHIPPPLTKQLKEGGRLIIPLGSTTYYQTLTLITKIKGELDVQHITGVAFVPMVGEAVKGR